METLPVDFPLAVYTELSDFVTAHDMKVLAAAETRDHTEAWKHFAMSHNAVRWRFRVCDERNNGYRAAHIDLNQNGTVDGRYVIERELFDFFVNLASTAENLSYCSFTVGVMVNPSAFPFATERARRKATPKATRDVFTDEYPGEQVTHALETMWDAYRDIRKMRNVLSHRGSPPWSHFRSIGGPDRDRTEWGLYELDADTTSKLRPLLTQHTTDVLVALLMFAKAHLS